MAPPVTPPSAFPSRRVFRPKTLSPNSLLQGLSGRKRRQISVIAGHQDFPEPSFFFNSRIFEENRMFFSVRKHQVYVNATPVYVNTLSVYINYQSVYVNALLTNHRFL